MNLPVIQPSVFCQLLKEYLAPRTVFFETRVDRSDFLKSCQGELTVGCIEIEIATSMASGTLSVELLTGKDVLYANFFRRGRESCTLEDLTSAEYLFFLLGNEHSCTMLDELLTKIGKFLNDPYLYGSKKYAFLATSSIRHASEPCTFTGSEFYKDFYPLENIWDTKPINRLSADYLLRGLYSESLRVIERYHIVAGRAKNQ